MTIDSSPPTGQGPRPDWRLPDIVDIEIRRIAYQPRRLRNFDSSFARYDQAIEFIVRTAGPIPVRALAPALFVAGQQVIESEQLAEDAYRFLAFELQQLEEGAPISWGWVNAAEDERTETGFRYYVQ